MILSPDFTEMYYDIHTHAEGLKAEKDIHKLVSISWGKERFFSSDDPSLFFSVGIHPWDVENLDLDACMGSLFNIVSSEGKIVAIGECGLDRICGTSIDIQERVFENQIILSEEMGKPLIVHCTRAWDLLLSFKKKTHPVQRWIVHGFRGNPALMKQLLDQGIYISFGMKYNPGSVDSVPLDRIFLETDKYSGSVKEVYDEISRSRGIEKEMLEACISANYKCLFPE